MAAPGTRMRLSVEVLPLTEENARGPYRAQALEALKGRKFALPVQLEDTLERVWAQIEQRYKINYLTLEEASAFTIQKLQDAYDCDLDVGDTVGAIFEGEADPTKRVIKVVPAFITRDFSVLVTSNLRPGHAQKRIRELNAERSRKRRRIERQPSEDLVDPDQPLPTTESERSGDDSAGEGAVNGARASSHSRRSHTGGSLVFVNGTQTGNSQFGQDVKEESPEPSSPPNQPAPPTGHTFKKPPLPVSRKTPHKRNAAPVQSEPSTVPVETQPQAATAQDVPMQDVSASAGVGSAEREIQRSPKPTSEPSQATASPVATRRKDVYDVPSSPEFMSNKPKSKSVKTYARSPRKAKTVQKEIDLLNHSRLLSSPASVTNSLSKKARAFQLPSSDEIESTPQEESTSTSRRENREESLSHGSDLTTAFLDDAAEELNGTHKTPDRNLGRNSRPGSLKRPSKAALLATPSLKRGVQFDGAGASSQSARNRSTSRISDGSVSTPSASRGQQLDPTIRARLDKLKSRARQSPKVVVRQSALQSSPNAGAALQTVNTSPATAPPNSSRESGSQPNQTAARSSKTQVVPSDENSRLSVQPPPARITPLKSPVPLPENVRNLNANQSANTPPKVPNKETTAFKKPVSTTQTAKATKPEQKLNGTSKERRASASSERRSTPLRNEIPITATLKSTVKATPPASTARKPLPSTTGRGMNSIQMVSPKEARSSNVPRSSQKSSQSNADSLPKKRGNAPASTPAKPPAHKRMNFFSSSADSFKMYQPTAAVKSGAMTEKPEKEPIVISSREASPSVVSDSGDERENSINVGINGNKQRAAISAVQEDEVVEPYENIDLKGPRDLNGPASSSPDMSFVTTYNPDNDLQEAIARAEAEEDELIQSQPVDGANSNVNPWQTPGWGFDRLDRPDVNMDEPVEPEQEVHDPTPAGDDDEVVAQDEIESRSVSAAVSTRSSPALTRKPARFLSHSPTPEASPSDSESEETSGAPSKATTPQETANDQANDSDSDSSSSDDSSSLASDTEIPSKPKSASPPAEPTMPSSPPRLAAQPPKSTPILPPSSNKTHPSSQIASPPVRRTPVPLPPNANLPPRSSQFMSSQSISTQAAARRPAARYTGFRSLREQLDDVKDKPRVEAKKAFDPRTMSLGKLAKRGNAGKGGKGAVGAGVGDEGESSSEESSSEESSSESD